MTIPQQHPTTVSPAPVDEIARSFDRLVHQISDACADPTARQRLGDANTTVHLLVVGRDDLACTLRFAGAAPEVQRSAHGAADGRIWIEPELVGRFWDRPLAAMILSRDAGYEGHVRPVLAVLPIVRALARERSNTPGAV